MITYKEAITALTGRPSIMSRYRPDTDVSTFSCFQSNTCPHFGRLTGIVAFNQYYIISVTVAFFLVVCSGSSDLVSYVSLACALREFRIIEDLLWGPLLDTCPDQYLVSNLLFQRL